MRLSKKSKSCLPAGFCKRYGAIVRFAIVIATPILLLPMPLVINTPEAKTAYTLIVMAIYWTTEALPLGITALVPMIMLPMFGIVKSGSLSMVYMKENVMLMIGGYTVAMTIEKWNLHKRLALKILLTIGSTPPRLILGFMLATMLLSMWISNTATATMMVPIVEAVLQELKKQYTDDTELQDVVSTIDLPDAASDASQNETNEATKPNGKNSAPKANMAKDKEKLFKNLCKAMCLCISYSACFGGSSTLIGSGAIVLGKSQMDLVFEAKGLESGINFPKWMAFVMPISITCMVIAWFWLQFWWLGFRHTLKSLFTKSDNSSEKDVRKVLFEEYKKLGPVSFAEKGVIVHFAAFALLLLTRDLGTTPGWNIIFPDGYIGSSVPAILVAILLFVCPAYPFWKQKHAYDMEGNSGSQINNERYEYVPLINMKTLTTKMPWNILLLFGGGMAIAEGCQVSGLSAYIGDQLGVLQTIPREVLVGIVCLFLSLFTEFTSNVAVVSIVMPILAEMAEAINANPLFFMLPGNIAVTYAFMLPVATPPNAIVFSYGHLRVFDMVTCGFAMNIICVLVLTLAANTWGDPIFGFNSLPDGWIAETTTVMSNTTLVT